jgi:hypothetical protein
MHMQRVFRSVCLLIMQDEEDKELKQSALVDPIEFNVFGALNTVYKVAKALVPKYGNVRVFNAEKEERPKGSCLNVCIHNAVEMNCVTRGTYRERKRSSVSCLHPNFQRQSVLHICNASPSHRRYRQGST